MITIDETKLTNGTLLSILLELEPDLDLSNYYYKMWTEEEIQEKINKLVSLANTTEDQEHLKAIEIILREAKDIDYNELFVDKLWRYKNN